MTTEEIKQNLTMREVVERYGLKIGRGEMVSCPWHGDDRHASMKIYKDSFHCFACGASGDVFSFVMKMDGCDFKTAFLTLGGTYDHEENEGSIKKAVLKNRIMASKDEKNVKSDIFKIGGRIWTELTDTLDWCKFIKKYHPPFTSRWCIAVDAIPELDDIYRDIFCTKDGRKKADGVYIFTRCKKIKQKLFQGA